MGTIASFGTFLRSKRKQRGLTAVQLCELSGISQPYLSQLENDKIDNPSPEIMQKLAGALGIPFSDMLSARGYGVMDLNELEETWENTQEITWYLEQMMEIGRPTLNGKFISNVELKRMLGIIKLSFPEYFPEEDSNG